MGNQARLYAGTDGLTEQDVGRLAHDGLVPAQSRPDEPIHGIVLRDGQPMAFTLDPSSKVMPAPRRVLPEQFAIAGLVMASFVAPIWHLLG